jgi:hypothetical protein
MVTHIVKTTIEIPDPLLRAAQALARRRKTTLRALVEVGLRRVLDEERRGGARFVLRDASVGGQGLAEGLADDWTRVLDLAYEHRG